MIINFLCNFHILSGFTLYYFKKIYRSYEFNYKLMFANLIKIFHHFLHFKFYWSILNKYSIEHYHPQYYQHENMLYYYSTKLNFFINIKYYILLNYFAK
jgi:hypothetical protein